MTELVESGSSEKSTNVLLESSSQIYSYDFCLQMLTENLFLALLNWVHFGHDESSWVQHQQMLIVQKEPIQNFGTG